MFNKFNIHVFECKQFECRNQRHKITNETFTEIGLLLKVTTDKDITWLIITNIANHKVLHACS